MFTTTSLGSTENAVPSLARTASGNTGAFVGTGAPKGMRAQLNVSAVAGTLPTLDVTIQDSLDGGVTWNTIGTFTQKTGVVRDVINITTPFAPLVRVAWVIGGTTPSFTFAVDWFVY